MTKETLKKLQAIAARQAQLDFERDVLMLRSRADGDSMTDIARAAGLSRTHAYRLYNEAYSMVQVESDNFPTEADALASLDSVKSWNEFGSK